MSVVETGELYCFKGKIISDLILTTICMKRKSCGRVQFGSCAEVQQKLSPFKKSNIRPYAPKNNTWKKISKLIKLLSS